MNENFDNLIDRINAKPNDEEIPEPGSKENPWIGFDRVVNGRKQFHALSGAERRRSRRAYERAQAAEQQKGQRRYNRQQRRAEFDAGTVRQQMRILTGELQVTPDMRANLEAHIIRQTRLNERAASEPERKRAAAIRRQARLNQRRINRIDANRPRHADLVFAGERTA